MFAKAWSKDGLYTVPEGETKGLKTLKNASLGNDGQEAGSAE